MIHRVQLVRNIGLFNSVAVPTHLSLARLKLIYAENGRGKTTLAAILRSLASGNPIPIAERRRLSATSECPRHWHKRELSEPHLAQLGTTGPHKGRVLMRAHAALPSV